MKIVIDVLYVILYIFFALNAIGYILYKARHVKNQRKTTDSSKSLPEKITLNGVEYIKNPNQNKEGE